MPRGVRNRTKYEKLEKKTLNVVKTTRFLNKVITIQNINSDKSYFSYTDGHTEVQTYVRTGVRRYRRTDERTDPNHRKTSFLKNIINLTHRSEYKHISNKTCTLFWTGYSWTQNTMLKKTFASNSSKAVKNHMQNICTNIK